ncbi:MAG: hypothetical protein NWF10_05865 [Candidatus Bathyarchaeota archaeon]|nr:hypothetical protein [Candidatus Bathyarchaeota archaeon]
MDFRDLLNSNWLARTIIVVWIITAILVISMLTNLDHLVNSTLYDFGLQFSNEWANPYWMYLRLSYAFLCVSLGLGFSAIILGFYRSRTMVTETIAIAEKYVNQKRDSQTKTIEKKQTIKGKASRSDETGKIISCPNCSKGFSRPMVMLNFEGGKTRLINVCPYCNHELGKIDENGKSNTEFHVQGEERSEFDHRIERT